MYKTKAYINDIEVAEHEFATLDEAKSYAHGFARGKAATMQIKKNILRIYPKDKSNVFVTITNTGKNT